MNIELRDWQKEAATKCLKWYTQKKDNKFVINAAPGSGKTITACVIADELLEKDEIDRVVVIAPRKKINLPQTPLKQQSCKFEPEFSC